MLWNLPDGAYGISYDISTRKTEDDLPHGWHSYRAAMYRELVKELGSRDYDQLQYSDWINEDTTAADAYITMVSLMSINPPGKLQSTLKGIKVHYLAHPRGLDGSDAMRLGGAYSPHLRGPTPAGLVPGNVAAVAPQVPLQPLPRFTKASERALNMNNWRIQP
ncbi:hypothetical protein SCLCIDRAFT_136861 [Scleroderma citrinum Foug A]|uniref:Uncharacterized protein n=1 Tax=Scleroderma citrinum Foug A TaxID=1036808 RepID=A0A0C3D0R3_9AGAM|nr:hypothetical protein SCLCIDRAFT_136861 [Scleroderma citrinum Foug A]